MNFRPCIDIHNGKVKQIVGGTLSDSSGAQENFVATKDADYYADMYRANNLKGGHIILLNKAGTREYELTKEQAILALNAFPGGMQIGGGITSDNAREYIEAGASHVIVTSYVFDGPKLAYDRINSLLEAVGREHIVIDLSCRCRDGKYMVVTDRWQTFTDVEVNGEVLDKLSRYCDEFLIHGVDVEGKQQGIDESLLSLLGGRDDVTITYAGGVRELSDIDTISRLGKNKIDFTIGSALNLFGGKLSIEDVMRRVEELN